MKTVDFKPWIRRELCALPGHRSLLAGWLAALLGGAALALFGDTPTSRLWLLYQLFYYAVPLFALLGTIMLVRQDLREAPLLALLPGASPMRVGVKTLVALGYFGVAALLLVAPSALRGEALRFARLLAGGLLVVAVFCSLGVWRAFRAKTEVRAYFGGLAWWLLLLLGSSAMAYGAHLWLRPEFTPTATLATLMGNPVEAFRIFVFFTVNEVPMNPQTQHPVAAWWLAHPLGWLGAVALLYALPALCLAGWHLRLRASAA